MPHKVQRCDKYSLAFRAKGPYGGGAYMGGVGYSFKWTKRLMTDHHDLVPTKSKNYVVIGGGGVSSFQRGYSHFCMDFSCSRPDPPPPSMPEPRTHIEGGGL